MIPPLLRSIGSSEVVAPILTGGVWGVIGPCFRASFRRFWSGDRPPFIGALWRAPKRPSVKTVATALHGDWERLSLLERDCRLEALAELIIPQKEKRYYRGNDLQHVVTRARAQLISSTDDLPMGLVKTRLLVESSGRVYARILTPSMAAVSSPSDIPRIAEYLLDTQEEDPLDAIAAVTLCSLLRSSDPQVRRSTGLFIDTRQPFESREPTIKTLMDSNPPGLTSWEEALDQLAAVLRIEPPLSTATRVAYRMVQYNVMAVFSRGELADADREVIRRFGERFVGIEGMGIFFPRRDPPQA